MHDMFCVALTSAQPESDASTIEVIPLGMERENGPAAEALSRELNQLAHGNHQTKRRRPHCERRPKFHLTLISQCRGRPRLSVSTRALTTRSTSVKVAPHTTSRQSESGLALPWSHVPSRRLVVRTSTSIMPLGFEFEFMAASNEKAPPCERRRERLAIKVGA